MSIEAGGWSRAYSEGQVDPQRWGYLGGTIVTESGEWELSEGDESDLEKEASDLRQQVDRFSELVSKMGSICKRLPAVCQLPKACGQEMAQVPLLHKEEEAPAEGMVRLDLPTATSQVFQQRLEGLHFSASEEQSIAIKSFEILEKTVAPEIERLSVKEGKKSGLPLALQPLTLSIEAQKEKIEPKQTDSSVVTQLLSARSLVSDPAKSLIELTLTHQDRTFFHLYSIHKNEIPQVLVADMHYGDKSFHNVGNDFQSTELQRRRALDRTLIEEIIKELEEAISLSHGHRVQHLVEFLESSSFHELDRPSGQTNLAHALFGITYHLYKDASDQDISLSKPVGSDFGRSAFTEKNFPQKFLLGAISRLRSDLYTAWKI